MAAFMYNIYIYYIILKQSSSISDLLNTTIVHLQF